MISISMSIRGGSFTPNFGSRSLLPCQVKPRLSLVLGSKAAWCPASVTCSGCSCPGPCAECQLSRRAQTSACTQTPFPERQTGGAGSKEQKPLGQGKSPGSSGQGWEVLAKLFKFSNGGRDKGICRHTEQGAADSPHTSW